MTHRREWITVRLATFQVTREGRLLRGIVAGVFDMEEWRRIREEFDRANRLSTLGLLVSGLAHEIKNPLGSIHGLVQMLSEEVPADHRKRGYYDTILSEVQRLDGIMKRLLDLASPVQGEFREVALSDIVQQVAILMESEAKSRGVKLIGEIVGEGGHRVRGDPDRIKQALINVMKNAIEASPRGDRVRWTLRAEQPWAIISVENPGASIPEALASQPLSPFLSTKMGGSGLGLAITHQILHHHGGRLLLNNQEGGGILVRLFFPSLEQQDATVQDRGGIHPPRQGVP